LAVSLLNRRQKGLLNLPHKSIHTFPSFSRRGDVLRKGTCVAKIHKKTYLFLAEAQQVVGAD
jgi:hypothetical protein